VSKIYNNITEGFHGHHQIQGLGAGFVPKTLNTEICDEVIAVSSKDAFKK
jgi:cysteine synthase A